jgi:FKBP-type peptidyl-prolyl cis-trans isomerase
MVSGGRLASGGGVARRHSIYRALSVSAQALGLGVGIALFGCASEDELAESAVEPPAVVEELSVEDLVIGDGPECESSSEIVTIHYRGMLLDGQEFDSSYERGAPIVVPLDSLILGWRQGMPGMRVGGKRRLTVPEDLAYSGMAAAQAVDAIGSTGAGKVLIPPESTLVFEIELLAIGSSEDPESPSDIAHSAGE